MILAIASHGPSALWYATRGAGAMTLVLLTASVVLGIGEVRRWQPAGAPRFAVAALHRSISLLALTFLAIHVVTTLLDPFPKIGIVNAAVPLATDYRPLWMGLGTLSSDLLVAVAITSLLRRRLGYRTWRGVHWTAYACWPTAILHGLGTGSDAKATWLLALTLACVAAVVIALANRLAAPETPQDARIATTALLVASCIGLAVWLPQGPLAKGWARRAGTPASVLSAFSPKPASVRVRTAPADGLGAPFTAAVAGTVKNGQSNDGTAVVDLSMHLRDGPSGVLRIRLGGQALPNGGLQMDRSAVTMGPPSDPARFQGRIEVLQGTQLQALIGATDGRALRITLDLSQLQNNAISGRIHGTPVRSAAA